MFSKKARKGRKAQAQGASAAAGTALRSALEVVERDTISSLDRLAGTLKRITDEAEEVKAAAAKLRGVA